MEDFDELAYAVDVCNEILYHTIYPSLGITWEESDRCPVVFDVSFETNNEQWEIKCNGILVCNEDERSEYRSFLLRNRRSAVGFGTYLKSHIIKQMIRTNLDPRINIAVRTKYRKILNRYPTLRKFHAG